MNGFSIMILACYGTIDLVWPLYFYRNMSSIQQGRFIILGNAGGTERNIVERCEYLS